MEYQEAEIHLKDYLKVLLKHRWTVLACFVIIVTVVTVKTFKQTPVYQATAQLQIERDDPNVLDIEKVMELDASQSDYYQTQYKILKSRSLARGVIGLLGLDVHPEFDPSSQKKGLVGSLLAAVSSLIGDGDDEKPVPAAAEENRKLSRTTNIFLEKIKIEPLRNTRLVNVKAESFDPTLAASMANTLAALYIDRSLQTKVTTTAQAGDWISEQMADARQKLDAAEQALQAYKEKHGIISLDGRQNFMVQKLEELNSELTRSRTRRIELETRYDQLKRMQADGGSQALPEVIGNRLVQDYKAELVRLQAELAEMSKTYTPKHPKIIRLVTQIKTMRMRINEEIGRVEQGIRSEFEVAVKREESLAAAIEEQKREMQELNKKSIEFKILRRDAGHNQRIYNLLTKRGKETDLAGGMRTSNIRFVDEAEVPLSPIRPRKARNLALALIVGLMAGAGAAFFIEYLDDSVKDPDDLERYVHLPFLGPVPIMKPEGEGEGIKDFIVLRDPKSLAAEAYRGIRTSLLFTSPDDPIKTMVVTSPGPQEGKSVTTINMALALAGAGKRVLLVDADMRKPRIHKAFGLKNSFGLSNIIGGEDDIGRAINKTKAENLTVITSGPIPPNPSELLGAARMTRIIKLLRDRFDIVIFDCTPLIAVTDATILASRVDGTVLVVKAGATGRHILQRGKNQLEEVKARIVGVILNWVDVRKSTYYYSTYYYQNYYGEDNGSSKKKRGTKRTGRKRPSVKA